MPSSIANSVQSSNATHIRAALCEVSDPLFRGLRISFLKNFEEFDLESRQTEHGNLKGEVDGSHLLLSLVDCRLWERYFGDESVFASSGHLFDVPLNSPGVLFVLCPLVPLILDDFCPDAGGVLRNREFDVDEGGCYLLPVGCFKLNYGFCTLTTNSSL